MYGWIKFYERVEFEFLQKPQRHSKSIEIFNRPSLVVFSFWCWSECEDIQIRIFTVILLEVAVSQLLWPHNSQFEKHLARGHVHSGMYIHFTWFVSLNTHCDVVVRFAGVNMIKRFRYIILVVSVADCFHLSGTEWFYHCTHLVKLV